MKCKSRIFIVSTLALLLSACSDDSDDKTTVDPADNDSPISIPDQNEPVDDDQSGGGSVDDDDQSGGGATDDDPVTGDPSTGDDDQAGGGASDDDPVTGDPATGGNNNGGNDGGVTSGDSSSPVAPPTTFEPAPRPPTPDLGEPQIPQLADPTADAVPSPDSDDPFGFGLEFDPEAVVAGGPPTQPKNLRAELVSNDWAEINWAPSKDDGEVVQYTLRRSDGVEYIIRGDQTDISTGAQREIDKYWATTSFIDCNYTRFDDRVHQCLDGRLPNPGQTYVYTVTATDDEGQESAASEPLTVTYLERSNAPVPNYDDFFKDPSDRFAQEHDLSAVDYWLDDHFELVFQEEFNGDSLNPDKWQTRLTWGPETIINGEQQYFVDTQADPDFGYDPFVFNGESMTIEAIPVPDNLRDKLPAVCEEEPSPGIDQCEFLSGALSTYDRFSFIYGYTEGRFKVSGGYGALSSFYLYHRYKGEGTNFHAPEIDIVEYLGENPFGDEDAFQTYHYESPGEIKRSSPTMGYEKPDGGTYADGEWHTFGVLWEPQLVIWYIDGKEVKRLSGPQISRRPMNIVHYLVAGSGWAPTPDEALTVFPLRFEADYIRVYQRDAYTSTSSYGTTQ